MLRNPERKQSIPVKISYEIYVKSEKHDRSSRVKMQITWGKKIKNEKKSRQGEIQILSRSFHILKSVLVPAM